MEVTPQPGLFMITRAKHGEAIELKRVIPKDRNSATANLVRDRDFSPRQGSATTAMLKRIAEER
jgi:hypothetical protein